MLRSFYLSKFLLIMMFFSFSILQLNACGDNNTNKEPVSEKVKDAGVIHEAIVKEVIPEKKQPPAGVGKPCISGPKGHNCPDKQLLACVTVNSSKGLCFENCTATDICTLETEICREYSRGFKACFKMAKLGEKCSILDRSVCRGESAEPPEYCINGTCKARPKEGWSVGDNCSPPSGTQSDCKTGLLCISLSSSIHQCLKKCTKDSDCPSGESCWEKPLGHKVCVIAAKIGASCDRLKREFCKAADPVNRPVSCQSGKCKFKSHYDQLNEDCKQDFDPAKIKGSCDIGMICLGVAHFKSICYKSCKGDSDCPKGEKCALHPNDGKPLRACVIPAAIGKECNLVKRKMCFGAGSQILSCKPKKENEPEGTCKEVKAGDICELASDCGPMACSKVGDKRYCFVRCSAQNPNCPGGGACIEQDGVTICNPTGPKKSDEGCTILQGGGDKLNTSGLCVAGFNCIPFKKGNPSGVCMKPVAQCAAGACSAGHVCIPLKNKTGICALDCSKNATVCKPGTKCTALKSGKICGPNI